MGDKLKRWDKFKSAWNAFAQAYFGPWVVRFLAIIPALYAGLLGVQGIDAIIGLPESIHNLFPLTQWIPQVTIAWIIAAAFFLMSLAIAQHVSGHIAIASAENQREIANLRLGMKDIEIELRSAGERLAQAASLNSPAAEMTRELASLQKERDELRVRLDAIEANQKPMESDERLRLAKGHLRNATDDLRESIASNRESDEIARLARHAVQAGQVVLYHKDQTEWHKNFRLLDMGKMHERLAALDVFVDGLIIEQINDDFARSDLDIRDHRLPIPY